MIMPLQGETREGKRGKGEKEGQIEGRGEGLETNLDGLATGKLGKTVYTCYHLTILIVGLVGEEISLRTFS